ncbi:DUF4156 domain-containing protein [Arenimonas caeni]|jgi:hypothetical protein|uniref:DUF4156 domain-containing protein n=1 Tax=Arenimonas caeni TaxID=2058085 RepID=A0A2P6M941_9GAMM|nr:DUF4156 domain-containing protein [Arenimonas caeni]
MRLLILPAALLATLAGCTWVKMAPGASEVRVAAFGQDLSACERRGEVSVSVRNRLGPYERNDIRVRDELETLARNEAPGLGADTVQPKGEPDDGEQRFLAFRCRGAAPAARPATAGEDGAQTYPIED